MEGGYSRAEAGRLYLEELPHVLRAVYLRRIDRAREMIWALSFAMADKKAFEEAERIFERQESRLGRRMLSALDAAKDPKVRQRLVEIREALKARKQ